MAGLLFWLRSIETETFWLCFGWNGSCGGAEQTYTQSTAGVKYRLQILPWGAQSAMDIHNVVTDLFQDA